MIAQVQRLQWWIWRLSMLLGITTTHWNTPRMPECAWFMCSQTADFLPSATFALGAWVSIVAQRRREREWKDSAPPFYGRSRSDWRLQQQTPRSALGLGSSESSGKGRGDIWRPVPTPQRTIVRQSCGLDCPVGPACRLVQYLRRERASSHCRVCPIRQTTRMLGRDRCGPRAGHGGLNVVKVTRSWTEVWAQNRFWKPSFLFLFYFFQFFKFLFWI
jgi:hypothetical protein